MKNSFFFVTRSQNWIHKIEFLHERFWIISWKPLKDFFQHSFCKKNFTAFKTSDKFIKEALDENNNSFLTLGRGKFHNTAFTFNYTKKHYSLLLEMYNNYIKLDQSKDEYATKKIKRHCKFILGTLHTKQKVHFICFVAMHFLKELEL